MLLKGFSNTLCGISRGYQSLHQVVIHMYAVVYKQYCMTSNKSLIDYGLGLFMLILSHLKDSLFITYLIHYVYDTFDLNMIIVIPISVVSRFLLSNCKRVCLMQYASSSIPTNVCLHVIS